MGGRGETPLTATPLAATPLAATPLAATPSSVGKGAEEADGGGGAPADLLSMTLMDFGISTPTAGSDGNAAAATLEAGEERVGTPRRLAGLGPSASALLQASAASARCGGPVKPSRTNCRAPVKPSRTNCRAPVKPMPDAVHLKHTSSKSLSSQLRLSVLLTVVLLATPLTQVEAARGGAARARR